MGRSHAGFSSGMVFSLQRNVPTTGQTVTVNQTGATELNVVLDPAGLLATLTVTLPTGLYDSQKVSFMSTAAITALTVGSVSGGVIGAVTSLVVGGFATFVWSTSQLNWYRMG